MSRQHPKRHTYARLLGLSRLMVEIGVFSATFFSLAVFLSATVQAYHTIAHALGHLSEEGNTKHLMIAAVEQADTLLVGMALLIISLGMHVLFIGRLENVPGWLHIYSFDDLKRKLLGVVITALGVNFFSVALEWKGGSDILPYGLALAAVIGALAAYNVILERGTAEPEITAETENTAQAETAAQAQGHHHHQTPEHPSSNQPAAHRENHP